MDALIINRSEDTPSVNLDASKKTFNIAGRSLPEDAFSFYQPINTWLKEYTSSADQDDAILEIQLDYFNSSSGRYLLEMFNILQNATGPEVKVLWIAESDDELMIEKGEELKSLVAIPFEVKQV
ncbi:MAG: DUF1987 domain-containing protein [Flavobacteriales bacterium]|nr:DUF1987 domain-containing protein [Flavobacteriales bacterium]